MAEEGIHAFGRAHRATPAAEPTDSIEPPTPAVKVTSIR
jgi:hypothetical protein